MKLSEQTLKTNKPLYHGTHKPFISKRFANFEDAFYVTTSFTYAMTYARDYDNDCYDYVIEYKFKRCLDICNLKNRSDFARVLPYASKNGLTIDNLKEMADYDWYQFADDFKPKLVSAIKEAGFEGFFNWEFPPLNYTYYKDKYKSAPSFGIFDVNSLEQVKVWNSEEFAGNAGYQRQHNAETSSLRKMVLDAIIDIDWDEDCGYTYELKKEDFKDSGKITLGASEIYDYYKSLSEDELRALWELRKLYISLDRYTYKFNFKDENMDRADNIVSDTIYDESVKPADEILKNLDNIEIYLKGQIEKLSSSRRADRD